MSYGHQGSVKTCKLWREYIVTAGHDQTITLWKLGHTRPFHSVQAHSHIVSCLEVLEYPGNAQRALLVSGSWDKTVKVWQLPSCRLLHTLLGHSNRLRCLLRLG
ncbi:hypothetical protein EON64_19800, partial [archaeon]